MNEEEKQKKRKQTIEKLNEWQKNQAKTYRSYIKTSAVGLEFGLSIAVGALLGYFADKYFGWSPYGLIVGVIVGCIAAAKRLWIFVRSYIEKNGDRDDDDT